jgi:hypothetical protein
LCLAAGTALSVAQAGGGSGLQKGKPAPAEVVANQPLSKFKVPAPKTVVANTRSFSESDFTVVNPSKMIVNGRSVPFTVSETLGSVGATDNVSTLVYNNWVDSGTGTNTSMYTGSITTGTGTVAINAALDDVQFGGVSSAVTLAGYRLRWATSATINTADTYWIALQWYDGFNASANPVNTSYAGFVATEWDAPTTGWTPNAAYRSAYLISDFVPDDFITAGTSGALEWLALADAGGVPDSVTYPDVTPIFNRTAPTSGTSSNAGFFFANNVLDATASGSYPSPAIQFVDSTNTNVPILSNIAVSLVGFAAPGASYGACCLPNAPTGGCVSLQSSICTANGGVFKGAGTNCALALANVCSGLASGIAFNNGPLSTGSVTYNGTAASPAGRLWNEGVAEKHATTDICIQNLGGEGWWGGFDAADDFTVPTGETWTVSGIKVYLFNTTGTAPLSGAAARLELWKGFPEAAGSTVVAGNRTTNQTVTTTATNIYFNFSTADGTTPGYTYRIYEVNVPLATAANLTAGHYYWDIGYDTASVYSPFVTVMTNAANGGTEDNGGANAQIGLLQGTSPSIWSGLYDTPFAYNGGAYTVDGTCLPRALDFPFQVIGTRVAAPSCYANCDGSTGTPALTAADFTCFLTKFRASDSYANCDGSTGVPSLTAADFTCFLTKFRAGCS